MVVVLAAGNVWQYFEVRRLSAILGAPVTVPMATLDGGVTRAEVREGNQATVRAAGKRAGMPMDDIEHDAEDAGARVTGLLGVLAVTDGGIVAEAGSDEVIARADADADGGYLSAAQVKHLDEPVGDASVPFGRAEFRAWEAAPWTVEVYPRAYSSTTVLARNEDTGQVRAYTRMSIEANGVRADLPETTSTLVEDTSSRWSWSPRLYVGAGAGTTMHLAPASDVSLAVSLASYGPMRALPSWSVAHLGVGASLAGAGLVGVVVPVAYNAGRVLPLVENLHIGPALTVDSARTLAVTLQVSAGL